MPWVLGGCGCLILFTIIVAVVAYGFYRASHKVVEIAKGAAASASVTPEPTRVTNSPAPKASDAVLVTQGEAESFIRSFYHDIEQNDLDRVLAYFDETVD